MQIKFFYKRNKTQLIDSPQTKQKISRAKFKLQQNTTKSAINFPRNKKGIIHQPSPPPSSLIPMNRGSARY